LHRHVQECAYGMDSLQEGPINVAVLHF